VVRHAVSLYVVQVSADSSDFVVVVTG